MWVFACAISLFTSAIQVFVRDVSQMLPPLMTFWFFTTPILYSPSYLPELMQKVMYWNPMAWFVARLRELLLFGEVSFDYKTLLFVLTIVIFAWLSLRFFRRFSGHFEDFL
jgi:lipopolysaccharide transport system permease protein